MNALFPRPGILDITPYKPGESKVPGFDDPIKLASNESPLGPSPGSGKQSRPTSANCISTPMETPPRFAMPLPKAMTSM